MKTKNKKTIVGFSLVEMLVVIAVIAVIAAISINNFGEPAGKRSNARAAEQETAPLVEAPPQTIEEKQAELQEIRALIKTLEEYLREREATVKTNEGEESTNRERRFRKKMRELAEELQPGSIREHPSISTPKD